MLVYTSINAGASWARSPVNVMSHEGSFYPVELLRDFRKVGLMGSAFEEAFAAQVTVLALS
jgi:hypothetical protein